MSQQDDGQHKPSLDEAMRAAERRHANAVRTAWIVAAIAVAFFVASLIHGHLVGIPNWVPPH